VGGLASKKGFTLADRRWSIGLTRQ